jgi:cysteine desulfuration protein SufE
MHPSIETIEEAIVKEFEACPDWDERYKLIIKYGKQLPAIDKAYQNEAYQVQGCQSSVWMHAELNEDGTLNYYADSDALIVRGLIALLLKVLAKQAPQAILQSKLSFLERLELGKHISMQRNNGLFAMIKQMKLYAQVFALQAGSSSASL